MSVVQCPFSHSFVNPFSCQSVTLMTKLKALVKMTLMDGPSFAIAHTFCVGLRFLRTLPSTVPVFTKVSVRFICYGGKEILVWTTGTKQRKLGVTIYFSTISKLRFGKKKCHTVLYIIKAF